MLGSNEDEIRELVKNFPDVLNRAIEDWAKFKVAVEAGLFDVDGRAREYKEDVLDWFSALPRLWETVRPSYTMTVDGQAIKPAPEIVSKADRFMEKLASYYPGTQLGIAPLVIAGVLIAGALGLAGAFWAVGYVKKQNNISKLIDNTVAGKIDPSVLEKAIRAEQGTGLFGDIGSLLKLIFIGGAAILVLPLLSARRK